MNTRIPFLFAIAIAFSACSAANSEAAAQAVPATDTAVPAPPNEDDAFCRGVAAAERIKAQQAGYDAATTDRMTLASYQQCRLLSARKPG
jgi:putative hemolysin